MHSRLLKVIAAVAAIGGLGAWAAAGTLAAGDTDDFISPVSTTVHVALKTGTKATFSATIGGVALTTTCSASATSGKTPLKGLAFVVSNPTFTGCTDNFGGTDTITTNSTNGRWSVSLVDAANDEAKEAADHVRLSIPKAGATLTSTLVAGCVVTIAPTARVAVAAAYNDAGTAVFTAAKAPFSTTAACPGGVATGTASFSGTYVSTPAFHDAS